MCQKSLFFALFSFLLFSLISFSISVQAEQNESPLEITADGSLEWHRNQKFFKAEKNVRAIQGTTTLSTDALKALYSENSEKNMDIQTIEAKGSVRIDTGESKAYGDIATYDVKKGYAVMYGKKLRLESPDQIVTATDHFEYWVSKGQLIAVGNARAVREGDVLESDKIIAEFTENSKGQRILKSIEAVGSVVITTQTEILTGQRAVYEAKSNLAQMTGNVVIKRGPNILEGEKAEVDLNTNISKMFGSESVGGRVRGVFYPGSEKLEAGNKP